VPRALWGFDVSPGFNGGRDDSTRRSACLHAGEFGSRELAFGGRSERIDGCLTH
jgi:hypothetical protein